MERQCAWCRRKLTPDNRGKLCLVCAHKLTDVLVDLPEVLDVESVRELLHLKDAETVRRKHRRGELPPCIPDQKKLLWLKNNITNYLKYGKSLSVIASEEAQAILLALKLGYPIDQATLYGHDPGNLRKLLKEAGNLPDK